jgi:hypothetical protein
MRRHTPFWEGGSRSGDQKLFRLVRNHKTKPISLFTGAATER